MRIHLVTDRFEIGGGLEHIYQVARGIPGIRFGIFAHPGTSAALEKFERLNNVEIYPTGFTPDIVMQKKPGLVHIHHLRPLVSFFKNPFKRYGIPVIYTAHGLHIHKYEFQDTLKAKTAYFLRYRLEKRILRGPNRIIAVSREDKQFLEENYHLNTVTYLTNGIDFSRAAAAPSGPEHRARLRKSLGTGGDEFLFITPARFDFQKGHDILIKAIARIKDLLDQRKPRCRFIFAGDGPGMAAMKELSRQLSVSHHILFLGARTDVYELLNAGDACLLPSRWEGLPIVLLETGLLKVPAIASNTYGNREVIKKENGILFDNLDIDSLAHVLTRTLQDKYPLARFAGNLYNEIQTNYNLQKMLDGLEDLYHSLAIKPEAP
jgi:glycosyltransferase involved in cell wall biosynthesis